ncbi:MAG: hypothetical protein AAGU11_03985 [Syntrophobacteraceae bacterium]
MNLYAKGRCTVIPASAEAEVFTVIQGQDLFRCKQAKYLPIFPEQDRNRPDQVPEKKNPWFVAAA